MERSEFLEYCMACRVDRERKTKSARESFGRKINKQSKKYLPDAMFLFLILSKAGIVRRFKGWNRAAVGGVRQRIRSKQPKRKMKIQVKRFIVWASSPHQLLTVYVFKKWNNKQGNTA